MIYSIYDEYGNGEITIKFGYWFKFNAKVSFNFHWRIFKGDIHLDFNLHAG